jgi:citrate synthase
MPEETLTITDNRTGKTITVPISKRSPGGDETIRAPELRQLRVNEDDFGIMTYDPAFMNTAACQSSITFIDGDRGILEYRGYPIEQLCEQSTFLEVGYLLIHGELPTREQYDEWVADIKSHTMVHETVRNIVDAQPLNAHPMTILIGAISALSSFYPEAHEVHDPEVRMLQTKRLIAKVPTIAAWAYRHALGLPFVSPDDDLTYAGNFLSMMYKRTEQRYIPDPVLERALDVLFILHADHEQNASANAVRAVASTEVDPYSAVAAGVAALYGPLHGGANEAVLRMLREIGSIKRVPEFLKAVESGERPLMGFGHRVYKNYDPRARKVKQTAYEVFEVTGINPLLEIALELERIALSDDYFIRRKLYPNVDFYSGLIYEALKLPPEMFTALFAVARTTGWCAQWMEGAADPEQKIARPRQIYHGYRQRDFVPMERRGRSPAPAGVS